MLLGPPGSGKTSLMRALAGLAQKDKTLEVRPWAGGKFPAPGTEGQRTAWGWLAVCLHGSRGVGGGGETPTLPLFWRRSGRVGAGERPGGGQGRNCKLCAARV